MITFKAILLISVLCFLAVLFFVASIVGLIWAVRWLA